MQPTGQSFEEKNGPGEKALGKIQMACALAKTEFKWGGQKNIMVAHFAGNIFPRIYLCKLYYVHMDPS